MPTIHLIDDDQDFLKYFQSWLSRKFKNAIIKTLPTRNSSLNEFKHGIPNLILVDYNIPEDPRSLRDYIETVRTDFRCKETKVFLMTVYEYYEIMNVCHLIDVFVPKPFDPEKVLEDMKRFIR